MAVARTALCLFGLLFLFASCNATVTLEELAGTWKGECEVFPEGGSGVSYVTFKTEPLEYELHIESFLSFDCNGMVAAYYDEGGNDSSFVETDFDFGSDSDLAEEGQVYEFNNTLTYRTMTALHELARGRFMNSECFEEELPLNEAIDVLDLVCLDLRLDCLDHVLKQILQVQRDENDDVVQIRFGFEGVYDLCQIPRPIELGVAYTRYTPSESSDSEDGDGSGALSLKPFVL
ncbi:hypothetical protein QOT17_009083 [Balamuthia mandrillaris]